jgi:hypothetical protein
MKAEVTSIGGVSLLSVSSERMVANTRTAKHYSWGDGCDGWYLLKSPEMTIIQERMPAGAAEKMHRH